MIPEDTVTTFKKYIYYIKEKVDKCDNNMPYLGADLMKTIQDNVIRKTLSPQEGYELRIELYNTLKNECEL
jgi:hypothetical protein